MGLQFGASVGTEVGLFREATPRPAPSPVFLCPPSVPLVHLPEAPSRPLSSRVWSRPVSSEVLASPLLGSFGPRLAFSFPSTQDPPLLCCLRAPVSHRGEPACSAPGLPSHLGTRALHFPTSTAPNCGRCDLTPCFDTPGALSLPGAPPLQLLAHCQAHTSCSLPSDGLRLPPPVFTSFPLLWGCHSSPARPLSRQPPGFS